MPAPQGPPGALGDQARRPQHDGEDQGHQQLGGQAHGQQPPLQQRSRRRPDRDPLQGLLDQIDPNLDQGQATGQASQRPLPGSAVSEQAGPELSDQRAGHRCQAAHHRDRDRRRPVGVPGRGQQHQPRPGLGYGHRIGKGVPDHSTAPATGPRSAGADRRPDTTPWLQPYAAGNPEGSFPTRYFPTLARPSEPGLVGELVAADHAASHIEELTVARTSNTSRQTDPSRGGQRSFAVEACRYVHFRGSRGSRWTLAMSMELRSSVSIGVEAFRFATNEGRSMSSQPIIVFDVNETLLDLEAIRPTFDRIFDDPAAMRLWFAGLITYSEALTLAEVYVPFTEIGGAVLRMLAATRGIAISDADGAELTERFASMPPHPEVPGALRRLRDHGFRL